MSNPHNIQVGQKLWRVASRRRGGNGFEVTVSKVGRKWAELDGYATGRIDLETLCVDGGNYMSPATCYLSRESYEAECTLRAANAEFKVRMSEYNNLFSLEQIRAAEKILWPEACIGPRGAA